MRDQHLSSPLLNEEQKEELLKITKDVEVTSDQYEEVNNEIEELVIDLDDADENFEKMNVDPVNDEKPKYDDQPHKMMSTRKYKPTPITTPKNNTKDNTRSDDDGEHKHKNIEIISSYRIPDSPGHYMGLLVEIYKFKGTHPKIRMRRYVLSKSGTMFSNEDDSIRVTSMYAIREFLRAHVDINKKIEGIVDDYKKANTKMKCDHFTKKYADKNKNVKKG